MRRLYVAGVEPSVPFYVPLTEDRLRLEPFSIPPDRPVVTQVFASHTKDQTNWLADQIIFSGERKVGIVIYPFHLLRAYMTLVLSLYERERSDIAAFPIPGEVAPNDLFPEFNANAWTLMPGEIRRIAKYQRMGFLASFDMMEEYLNRLWQQL